MTDKISTGTPELKRRLEYAKRIRKAVDYKGTADHEDVQSILRKFQEEITKEFTDRIVEQLEECSVTYCKEYGYAEDENVLYLPDAIEIVKGAQND